MNGINRNLKLSPNGLELIKQSEGFRAAVYKDVVGVETVGYGHRVLPGESFPQPITEQRASQMLAADALIAATIILRVVNVPLKQGQFDALVDLAFNEGGEKVADSTLMILLNQGMYGAVPKQLYRIDDDGVEHGWIFAGGRKLEALITRRKAEIALWNS